MRQFFGGDPVPQDQPQSENDDALAFRDWSNPIADLEMVGAVAVATMTITELTLDDGADSLASLLDDLIQSGASHFVLDIQNVQYMDTTCLGCLVEALNRMSATGGKIALANPHNAVQYVFRLTRLDRVFPICRDVTTAIDAVEGKSQREAG
ncbi:MAG: STAS domain-containing protein [Planctomycetota bacterium]